MIQRSMLVIGLVTTGGYFVFRLAGSRTIAHAMIFIPLFAGSLVVLVRARQYDHYPKKAKWPAFVIGCLFVAVGILLGYECLPTRVNVSAQSVTFSGRYGLTIPVSEIVRAELVTALPRGLARTNGLAIGDIRKGYFALEGMGRCRLFLHTGHGPYLVLAYSNGQQLIYGAKKKETTERIYHQIRAVLR